MVTYKLEGLDEDVILPDTYLTVKQIESGYRSLVAKGSKELELDDPASGRILVESILGDNAPDFSNLPATPENMKTLFGMYAHVGDLFTRSLILGDEVIDEVEEKKESPEVKPKANRGRPRSKSR